MKSMEKRVHENYLDVAKGITIILVVLGHSFPENIYHEGDVTGTIANIIYSFIYSFHMPVFFFISGYLFYKALDENKVETIKKKATRLLVPYLTFSLIYIPLRILLSNMANSDYSDGFWRILIGVSPNGGVWYLYVLFVMFTFSLIFNRNNKNNLIFFTIFFFVIAILYHLDMVNLNYSVARYFLKYAMYFELGLLVRYYKNDGMNLLDYNKAFLYLLALVIVFSVYFVTDFKPFLIVTSCLGILSVLSVAHIYENNRLLGYLGKKSIDIYLLHGPIMVAIRWLLTRIHANQIVISIAMFALSLAMSLAVAELLHRLSITDVICFGNMKRIKEWRKSV